MKFRKLQTNTQGTLYLHNMLGRSRPRRYDYIEDCVEAMKQAQITTIICLVSDKERDQSEIARLCRRHCSRKNSSRTDLFPNPKLYHKTW